MSIPIVQTGDRNTVQLQQNIISAVSPMMSNPASSSSPLTSIALVVGDNTVNHGLNANLVGWYITRLRAASVIFDKQDTNPNPSKTLILNSSAAVTIDLLVF